MLKCVARNLRIIGVENRKSSVGARGVTNGCTGQEEGGQPQSEGRAVGTEKELGFSKGNYEGTTWSYNNKSCSALGLAVSGITMGNF